MRKNPRTTTTTERLTLRRESLRSLTKDELHLAAGGFRSGICRQ